ncbi:MAG: hypothetical protein ABJC74_01025, partial [Gemmatimonadota bacterium]
MLVLLGVLLRSWAYFARQPLWLDEILLSRNILELPLNELLTRPLWLDQVAPRGFLLVEKVGVVLFGGNEMTLRFFPFLSGIAGLILFRRLAVRVLTGLAVPFAVGLCAVGIPFLRFGAEVKQYSLDATGATLLMLVAVHLLGRDASTRRLVGAGLIGVTLVWFSQASVLIMGGIGLGLGCSWIFTRDRRSGRVLLFTMPLWGLASVAAVVAGRHSMSTSTAAFMDDFWRRAFLPWPVQLSSGLSWFSGQVQTAFSDPTMLRYRWPLLFVVAVLVGIVVLWRTRRAVALMILGPLVMALLAASAHLYPFGGRLMFYLVPGLILAIAAGVEWARAAVSRYQPILGAAVMAAVAFPPISALVTAPPPYSVENIPGVLAYLRANRLPGDSIYIMPLQRIGALFYGPRFGVTSDQWSTGICERSDSRAYLRDLDRYRGVERLWL